MAQAEGHMKQYVWPAIIAGVVAVIVAIVQYVVGPLVTQQDLSQAISESSPVWKVHDEVYTDKDVTHSLGQWDICTLSTVGTVHARQACTCKLTPENGEWTLAVDLDEGRRGDYCRCRAACINFLGSTEK